MPGGILLSDELDEPGSYPPNRPSRHSTNGPLQDDPYRLDASFLESLVFPHHEISKKYVCQLQDPRPVCSYRVPIRCVFRGSPSCTRIWLHRGDGYRFFRSDGCRGDDRSEERRVGEECRSRG